MNKNNKNAATGLGLCLALAAGSAFAQCTSYTISASPAETTEGGYLNFKVFRTGDPSAKVSVHYATWDATTTRNYDYTPVSGTLTFYPNQLMKTVSVRTKADTHAETAETMQLVLNGTGTQPPLTNGIGIIRDHVSVPAVPTLPAGPSVPSIPSIPSVPSVPSLPSVPSIPSAPSIPSIPPVPSLPGIPSVPKVPKPPSGCQPGQMCY